MAYVAGAMFGAGSETVSPNAGNITCARFPELMCALMRVDCFRDYDHDDGGCFTPGSSSESARGIRSGGRTGKMYVIMRIQRWFTD